MKRLLLILMFLASVAHAMTDAEMKKLIAGTWRSDNAGGVIELKTDGTVDYGKDIGSAKWAIKDGAYTETDETRTYYYKILYLTKTACLMLGITPHGKGYVFYWRKPEDVPDSVYYDKSIPDDQD